MPSKLYNKILIATDGSENTKKALDYGIDLAINTGAKLQAIYVVDTGKYSSIPMSAPMEYAFSILRQEGDIALKFVAEMAEAAGLEKEEGVIVEGNPADEIIKYAENNSIDLIVMGTMGKSGIDRFLMGSVADKVIRNSRIPVIAVPLKE
ncbi:MAG: universal stress protein [Candidatus Methanoperedens sp.]|nr:universal stress protein [Candidatus Methanoperedens sp.]